VRETYRIHIAADDELSAQRATGNLADDLRELSGVLGVEREKKDASTMDLGAIVTIIATSSATLAIAQGIADWLRRTRGVHLTIERDEKSGSVKAAIANVDQATSLRILEIIRHM
jgi:hypothetical protein